MIFVKSTESNYHVWLCSRYKGSIHRDEAVHIDGFADVFPDWIVSRMKSAKPGEVVEIQVCEAGDK